MAKLQQLEFRPFPTPGKVEVTNENEEVDADKEPKGLEYEYLLTMQIWALTAERKNELMCQYEMRREEYARLQQITPEQIWLQDLEMLESTLTEKKKGCKRPAESLSDIDNDDCVSSKKRKK